MRRRQGPQRLARAGRLVAALVLVEFVVLAAGCGKSGDPKPPQQPAKPVKQAKGEQPVRDAARARSDRIASENNLRQILIAAHDHFSVHGQLPPVALCDKDGKPLLSWRVVILPFIAEGNLFRQFNLDEPWDSPHNKKLISRMPKTYALPGVKTEQSGLTFYRTFTGPGAIYSTTTQTVKTPHGFGLGSAVRLQDVTDGTRNTIFLAEAAEPVIWTKPEELVVDPKKPLPKLGRLAPDEGFSVAMLDGTVRLVPRKVSEKTLRDAINPADGNILGSDWLIRKPKPAPDRGRNIQRMMIGVQNYASDYEDSLPPIAFCDKNGRTQLSWRVAVLPYVDEEELFRQFKLDEPWDSPQNKKLIARMPTVYILPGAARKEPGLTFYRAFQGPGTLYPGRTGKVSLGPTRETHGLVSLYNIGNIPDGTSNTIFLVEAAEPVIWTKPDELVIDPKKPLPKLGAIPGEPYRVGMMDGSIHVVTKKVSEKTLRNAINPADGNELGPDW